MQTGTAPLPSRSFATPAPGAVFGGVLAETEPDAPIPVLVLADGRRIPITAPVLLGRDPAPRPEHPDALIVAVADARRSVSKTHALLLARGGGLLVQDLGSTNGTWLVHADGRVAEALPGRPTEVPADARVELGECPLHVERG
jgi:pSer/pThr/pTyr-binding forkhead associated (FHA) protein